jgi:hypothetical protein
VAAPLSLARIAPCCCAGCHCAIYTHLAGALHAHGSRANNASPRAQKLYTFKGNFRAWKALIAAEYNGVRVEVPEFVLHKDNVTPEFKKKNPLGKVRSIARKRARLPAAWDTRCGRCTKSARAISRSRARWDPRRCSATACHHFD